MISPEDERFICRDRNDWRLAVGERVQVANFGIACIRGFSCHSYPGKVHVQYQDGSAYHCGLHQICGKYSSYSVRAHEWFKWQDYARATGGVILFNPNSSTDKLLRPPGSRFHYIVPESLMPAAKCLLEKRARVYAESGQGASEQSDLAACSDDEIYFTCAEEHTEVEVAPPAAAEAHVAVSLLFGDTSDDTKTRNSKINTGIKLQRQLAKKYNMEFQNLSHAIQHTQNQGQFQSEDINCFWRICNEMNAAKHRDFLGHGFTTDMAVECLYDGCWYPGVVQEVEGRAFEASYRVNWGNDAQCMNNSYWFRWEEVRERDWT